MEGSAKRRGDPFQDLGHLLGETTIIKDNRRPRLGILHVEEGLVAHAVCQPEPFRDLLEHGVEGMTLPLATLAGHGDVQSMSVFDRTGGKGEDKTFGHHFVADMIKAEGLEHGLFWIPILQDGDGLISPGHLFKLASRRGPCSGSWSRKRPCLRGFPFILGFVLLPEFLPSL
ncbi:MAG: hypothetical protein BWY93_01240 [Euryarchaeota archaeon ADurb.BinA087]|nr:MAG: hypothetical protein BWY93_01240 [Euryarchaeota archaeon ADurb.BinA087]